MSDARHRAPKARGRRAERTWFGRGRTRALLSLGLLFGFGAVGTMAYWTDQGTMTGGSITSGTLDLRLNNSATLVGQGGTWNNSASFTAANLIPGESVAFSFLVRNDGNVPFTYTATATSTGTLSPHLRFTTTHGSSTASNSGSAAAGNRVGTCVGNTVATSNVTLSGTPATVMGTPFLLPAGNVRTMCIVVSLPSGTGNGAQGLTATQTFVFDAVQVNP